MHELLFYVKISVYAACINLVHGANILAIFPLPAYSHFVMYRTILEELATKGHNIDVYSPFPLEKPLKGYNEHSLKDMLPSFLNNVSMEMVDNSSPRKDVYDILMETQEYHETILSSQLLQDLIKSDKKYDLFLTEVFGNECMFAFGHHFKIPTVGFTSSVDLPWGASKIGNPDNPSYISTYFSPYSATMSLMERAWNTITLLETKWIHSTDQSGNEMAKKHFGPTTPNLSTLVSNISLLLVNSHFTIHQARPLVPNFIEIGGVHIKQPIKLTDETLKKLVEENKPVVYLSTGSMILTETFPKEKLQALFDAFKELSYNVLWRADKSKFPEGLAFPENVHFLTWMPQLDLLCHPNVRIFVSHGGLMGLQEAIFCGTPILGIPLFADQKHNLQQSENDGYAIQIDYHQITKEKIFNAAQKLIEEPKYLDKAVEKSVQFRDRIKSPLETAIFWIEYVIRHKGAKHLRSVAASLPLYQYYLLDVVCVLIGVPILAIVILVMIVRRFLKRSIKKKTKKQ